MGSDGLWRRARVHDRRDLRLVLMALFWLTYKTRRGTEVFIAEAAHLMMARVKASMAE